MPVSMPSFVCKPLHLEGFPDSSVGKDSLQCRRPRFNSWDGKIGWRRDRLPMPVFLGFPVAQLVKNLPAVPETWVQCLGWEDPREKGRATCSSVLAWRIPRTTILWPSDVKD